MQIPSRMLRNRFGSVALLLLVAATTVSCFGPKTDTSRYYVLTTIADRMPDIRDDLVVGVGPVTLPNYLSRAQMATRLTEHEIDYSSDERWAEPFAEMVQEALSVNLAVLLGTGEVRRFPWHSADAPDIVVEVDILHYERNAINTVILNAFWEVELSDGTRIVAREARFEEPITAVTGPDVERLPTDADVAAMSRALEQLSREIARAVADAVG